MKFWQNLSLVFLAVFALEAWHFHHGWMEVDVRCVFRDSPYRDYVVDGEMTPELRQAYLTFLSDHTNPAAVRMTNRGEIQERTAMRYYTHIDLHRYVAGAVKDLERRGGPHVFSELTIFCEDVVAHLEPKEGGEPFEYSKPDLLWSFYYYFASPRGRDLAELVDSY